MALYPAYPITLSLQTGSLVPGVCFRTEQARLNAYTAMQFVTFPSNFSRVIVSPSQPTVEEQSALWIQSDAFNNAVQQFLFSSQYGQWLWPHIWPANDPRLVLFTGTLGEMVLLDGGDAGAITATTGSFWSVDADFTDKLPIGAGTVPEGVDALKFDIGTPAYPAVRGAYFIRRTARVYLTP